MLGNNLTRKFLVVEQHNSVQTASGRAAGALRRAVGGDAKQAAPPLSNFPSAGPIHAAWPATSERSVTLFSCSLWWNKGDLASLVSPERGGDALLLSLRHWQGDASLIQSHVQVPEALHRGGGWPCAVEQRLPEMGGGGGGEWGEAAGFRDQGGAHQEPCLIPGHDEKALQLPQVSGEAE